MISLKRTLVAALLLGSSLAVQLIQGAEPSSSINLDHLIAALHVTSPPERQQAALENLKKLATPRVAELLLAKWNDLLPAARAEAASLLLSRAEWSEALLGAIESGQLTSSALGTVQQQKLLAHSQPSIRERAAKLFTKPGPDRKKILDAYRDRKSVV